jgi:hypothetical protein
MDERFVDEIDAAYPTLGYSDRASFIRDAVIKELAKNGIVLPAAYKAAPPRVGSAKGGRPKKPKIQEVADEGKARRAAG